MRFIWIAASTAVLLSLNAQAQTWEQLAVGGDGTRYAIDTSTMKMTSYGGTEVWVRAVSNKAKRVFSKKASPTYTEFLARSTFNCGQFTSHTGYMIYRDRNGENVHTESSPGMSVPVVPGSIGHTLYEKVCPSE